MDAAPCHAGVERRNRRAAKRVLRRGGMAASRKAKRQRHRVAANSQRRSGGQAELKAGDRQQRQRSARSRGKLLCRAGQLPAAPARQGCGGGCEEAALGRSHGNLEYLGQSFVWRSSNGITAVKHDNINELHPPDGNLLNGGALDGVGGMRRSGAPRTPVRLSAVAPFSAHLFLVFFCTARFHAHAAFSYAETSRARAVRYVGMASRYVEPASGGGLGGRLPTETAMGGQML